MTSVALKPITEENWRTCCSLSVEENQRNFVAPNHYSLAQAAYAKSDNFEPYSIYADDEMVGFVMFGYPEFEDKRVWFIYRLMVDKNHQRKGYGRKGMELAIEMMKSRPNCDEIYVSYQPSNEGAATLYEQLGFINEGKVEGTEIVVRLPVEQ